MRCQPQNGQKTTEPLKEPTRRSLQRGVTNFNVERAVRTCTALPVDCRLVPLTAYCCGLLTRSDQIARIQSDNDPGRTSRHSAVGSVGAGRRQESAETSSQSPPEC